MMSMVETPYDPEACYLVRAAGDCNAEEKRPPVLQEE